MRSLTVCVAIAAFGLPALAQPAAQSALGKTCRGTFVLHDVPPDRQQGAFQITLSGTDEKPAAHLWRGFGEALRQKVGNEIDSGTLSTDLTGFQDLGQAQDVVLSSNQVTLRTRQGSSMTLIYDSTTPSIYDGSAMVSTQAPGEPLGRLDWRSADTHILCR